MSNIKPNPDECGMKYGFINNGVARFRKKGPVNRAKNPYDRARSRVSKLGHLLGEIANDLPFLLHSEEEERLFCLLDKLQDLLDDPITYKKPKSPSVAAHNRQKSQRQAAFVGTYPDGYDSIPEDDWNEWKRSAVAQRYIDNEGFATAAEHEASLQRDCLCRAQTGPPPWD